MRVTALKLIKKREHSAQSIFESAEYFPRVTRVVCDGDGKLWIMGENGQRNYSRLISEVLEITSCDVQVSNQNTVTREGEHNGLL